MVDQVAGAQVVVNKMAGAQMVDQVARVQVVVYLIKSRSSGGGGSSAGDQMVDQVAGAQVVVDQWWIN